MKLIKSLFLASILLVANAFAAVNINTASVEELKTLKGIGEAKAKAIVEYRTANGNFASVEDLAKVKGIGDKILADIKSEVIVDAPAVEATTEANPDAPVVEVKTEEVTN